MALFTEDEYKIYGNDISEIAKLSRTIESLQDALNGIDLAALKTAEDNAIVAFSNAESAFVNAERNLEDLRTNNFSEEIIHAAEDALSQARFEYEKAKIERERATDKYNNAAEKKELIEKDIDLNKGKRDTRLTDLQAATGNRSLSAADIANEEREWWRQSRQKSIKGAKEQKIVGRIAQVEKILHSINNIVKEGYQASIDIQLKQIETMTKIQSENIRTQGKMLSNAIGSSLKSYTGVREGAYAATQASIDSSLALQNFQMDKEEAELSQKNYEEVRTAKRNATISKEFATAAGVAIGLAAGGPIGAAIGAGIGQLVGVIGDWMVAAKENDARLSEVQLKYAIDTKKSTLEQADAITRTIREDANQTEGNLEKHQANAVGVMAALGQNMNNKAIYEKTFFNNQTNLGYTTSDGKFHHYDKDGEDMAKWQGSYVEKTGRSIAFGNEEYNSMAALGKIMGDDDAAVSLAASMELFNHSVASSTDMFYEMYKTANKIGISNRKYSKELVKNLQLAEKIQFKGGTKALMEMALWAQKTRFNMDSLNEVLGKIQDGGLENLITTGAGMQVLGGNFAMGADPLAMGWEAFNDPQAFAKRQVAQMSGIGTFNKKTGEVDFNMADQMRLQQFAKLTGQSKEDLMNQRRQAIKGSKVEAQLNKGHKWSEEEKSLITQKAKLNTVTGKYEVDLGNGQAPVDISTLTQDDMVNLLPVEEKIEDHVSKIMSYTAQMAGITKYGNAKKEENVRTTAEAEWDARMEENMRFFNDATGALKAQIEEQMRFVTAQNKLQHTIMEGSTRALNDYHAVIISGMKDIAKAIVDAEKGIARNLSLIAADASNEEINIANGVADEATYRAAQQDPNKRKNLTDEEKNKTYNQDTRSVGRKILDFLSGMKSSNWVRNEGDTKEIKAKEKQRDSHNSMQASMNESMMMAMDATATANGEPMAVAASSVTPIHDGAVARTDPQDHAIFAKVGGSFDKLFDGILGKINRIYSEMFEDNPTYETYTPTSILQWSNRSDSFLPTSNSATSNYANRMRWDVRNVGDSFADDNSIHSFRNPTTLNHSNIENSIRNGDNLHQLTSSNANSNTTYANSRFQWSNRSDSFLPPSNSATSNYTNMASPSRMSPKQYDPFKGLKVMESTPNVYQEGEKSDWHQNKLPFNNTPIKIEPITLNIVLDGTLGKSNSLVDELAKDPLMLRSITQLISNAISNKVNGGRHIYNGGDLVSF